MAFTRSTIPDRPYTRGIYAIKRVSMDLRVTKAVETLCKSSFKTLAMVTAPNKHRMPVVQRKVEEVRVGVPNEIEELRSSSTGIVVEFI